MGSVNLVVVVESVRSIIDHKSGDLNEFHIPSLVAVGAALGELLFLTPHSNERISPSECASLSSHENRRESSPIHLLLCPPQELKPGSYALGRPQE